MTTPQSRPLPPRILSMSGSARRHALREVWAAFLGNIRTRRQLLELSEAQLRDIGLTRGQALREAWQPVWRNTAKPVRIDTQRDAKQDGTPYAAIG